MSARAAPSRPPEELLRFPRRDGDLLVLVDWRGGLVAFTREGEAEPVLTITARELVPLRVLLETCAGRAAFRGV